MKKCAKVTLLFVGFTWPWCLWCLQRLTDMNRELKTNCYGLTTAVADYEAKALGKVCIPVLSLEHIL